MPISGVAVAAATPAAGAVGPAAGGFVTTEELQARRRHGKRLCRFDPLRRLPDQLIELVVAYVPVTDLGNLMAVARHYRALIPSFVIDLKCLAHHVPQLSWPDYTEVRSLTVTCDAAAGVPVDVAYWLSQAAQSGCFTKVETLHLYGNRIGDGGLALLASCFAKGAFPYLRCLDLSWNDLSDVAAKLFAKVLVTEREGGGVVLPFLTQLLMERNQLSDHGCGALISSLTSRKGSGMARLEMLSLSNNNLKGGGNMMKISQALRHGQSIQVLSLNWMGIKDEGAKLLASSLSQMTSLQRLDLEGNQIGNRGAAAISSALSSGGMPDLAALNLKNNHFSDDGVVALAEALCTGCCPKLSSLDLSGNCIACEGAIALAGVLARGRCALQSLSLAWNNLSDDGATAFASTVDVKTWPPSSARCSLEKLDMGNNSIGDLGVRALAHAFRFAAPLSQLRQIDLTGNDFHDGGLNELVTVVKDSRGGKLHKVAVYNGIYLDQLLPPSFFSKDKKPAERTSKTCGGGGGGTKGMGGKRSGGGSSSGLFGTAGFLLTKMANWAWSTVFSGSRRCV